MRITPLSILQSQHIEYQEIQNELVIKCQFSDCDDDSKGKEAHMYINKDSGAYYCHKCFTKGGLKDLLDHFSMDTKSFETDTKSDLKQTAIKYHLGLPPHIKNYLVKDRLLHDEEINDRLLGYMVDRSGVGWITIPVFSQHDEILFIKMRIDPSMSNSNNPKYKSSGGLSAMYNAQIINDQPERLVICEGEFDCMLLSSLGVPAISSTAGAGTFKDEWVDQLSFVREFFVIMDNDDPGRKGAETLIQKLHAEHPDASIMHVQLPSVLGNGGDITDFIKGEHGNIDDLLSPDSKLVNLVSGPRPINPSSFNEMSLDELDEILSMTIKFDRENKLITFFACLSAYTLSDQINVSYNAPSSSGKTYIVNEVAKLFPDADKIESNGASPTSFFHGSGKIDEKRNAKIINLSRKILIFYELPNPILQSKLRSVLSHDSWEINHRITNKDKKGAHRSEHIILAGFPATIFCSANMRLDEQEATRAILLSPEVSQEKLSEGVHLQALRAANPEKYNTDLDSDPRRKLLKDRILAIKRERVDHVTLSHSSTREIEERFMASFQKVKPRHMRDVGHLIQLIKAITLLNVWHRQDSDGKIVVSQLDIEQGLSLWMHYRESQDLNISPIATSFYKQYILPAYLEKRGDNNEFSEGVTRQEVCKYYLKIERAPYNDEYLRKQILPQLENSGLISQEQPQSGDKRTKHIIPKWFFRDEDI